MRLLRGVGGDQVPGVGQCRAGARRCDRLNTDIGGHGKDAGRAVTPVTRSGPVEGERTRSGLFTVWSCLMGAAVGWAGGAGHYLAILVIMVIYVLGALGLRHIGVRRNEHQS
jgi:hypothetical protein